MKLTNGIHHITAGSADGGTNVRFSTEILGLRLVKKTVNFDDPSSYHLYYGDAIGAPGSILTFFVWPDAGRGTRGSGEATSITFAIPSLSLGWWKAHLVNAGVLLQETSGPNRVELSDADGMHLVLSETVSDFAWTPHLHGAFGADVAIRGIVDLTLSTSRLEESKKFLTETLGLFAQEDNRTLGFTGSPTTLTLEQSHAHMHRLGAGSIHHVALRVANAHEQRERERTIAEKGRRSSPIMERVYFKRLYFREPSGVLIELATDTPGFSVDEPVEKLGTALCLPAWMDGHRAEIERVIPALYKGGKAPCPLPPGVNRFDDILSFEAAGTTLCSGASIDSMLD
jgi:catechol 2,3-dioxygenase-like lactoylglutathione lyase family enzyme